MHHGPLGLRGNLTFCVCWLHHFLSAVHLCEFLPWHRVRPAAGGRVLLPCTTVLVHGILSSCMLFLNSTCSRGKNDVHRSYSSFSQSYGQWVRCKQIVIVPFVSLSFPKPKQQVEHVISCCGHRSIKQHPHPVALPTRKAALTMMCTLCPCLFAVLFAVSFVEQSNVWSAVILR